MLSAICEVCMKTKELVLFEPWAKPLWVVIRCGSCGIEAGCVSMKSTRAKGEKP